MGERMLHSNGSRTGSEATDLVRLLEPIAHDLARVEASLLGQVGEFEPGVRDHVRYVLGGTGKRLRPSLALLAAGTTGRVTADHITLGVIVELIHIATLVHDDVLDEAGLRHGLPTANSRWGNDVSVLVGDCLFAHALTLAASYMTTEICRKVGAAANAVCAGEILQTQRRFDLDLSLDDYVNIIRLKTGALFAVSCELGAFLNAAPPTAVKGLSEFGSNLGVAYQIYDDCVDIFGQERQAGKSLGTDMKTGKLTLPLLLLLQHSAVADRREVSDLIFRAEPGDRARLLDLVLGNGVMAESLSAIETYIARAEANLADLPINPYTATLTNLLGFLANKSRVLLTREVAV
jgi:octaprenyl-diphosphate synthase